MPLPGDPITYRLNRMQISIDGAEVMRRHAGKSCPWHWRLRGAGRQPLLGKTAVRVLPEPANKKSAGPGANTGFHVGGKVGAKKGMSARAKVAAAGEFPAGDDPAFVNGAMAIHATGHGNEIFAVGDGIIAVRLRSWSGSCRHGVDDQAYRKIQLGCRHVVADGRQRPEVSDD